MDKGNPSSNTIYTIGYGTRTIDKFISLLRSIRVDYLVDVRSSPFSKHNEDFSQSRLRHHLKTHGIGYVFMGNQLGGRPSDETCYTDGKVDYDKVRNTEPYKKGIARLYVALEKKYRIVLMCSELKPQNCHRSKLIGQTLIQQGICIQHIDERDKFQSQEEIIARLTNGQLNIFEQSFTSRKIYLKDTVKTTSKLEFMTIGVYGFNETTFFETLVNQGIDTFCDIRQRRGMRGSKYSFVNSAYLQNKLQSLGIKYIHAKELAPNQEVRSMQQIEDQLNNITKRDRTELNTSFIEAYEQETLCKFDFKAFISNLGPDTNKVVFFCVEREPEACHRSLVARKITNDLRASVKHIKP